MQMVNRLRVKIMMARYGVRLGNKFRIISMKLIKNWKFLRDYPVFLNKIYNELVGIAKSRNVAIPKPRIDMKIKGEI